MLKPALFLRKSAIAASAIAAFGLPAAAEQALSPLQCRDALVIGNAVMTKYAVSPRLATSFKNFRLSNCDPKTVFERDTDIDDKAFGEFRVKLIALRTNSARLDTPAR
jgi:hypothetical protein